MFDTSLTGGLYVQYGSSFCSPDGWINFDCSPTLRFEKLPIVGRLYTKNAQRFPESVRYGDIVRGLPIPPNSCNGIYASHVLEHLSLDDFHTALANTLKVLRPGGRFRLVVPDLEALTKAYLASDQPQAAEIFIRSTMLGKESRSRTLPGFIKDYLGNCSHLWMWDYKALHSELIAAGFTGIRRCAFGDCVDPMFKAVEDPDRFGDAVAIECSC